MEHTKGEWDVRGLCVGIGVNIIANVQDGINSKFNKITDINQAEANAKLIAAAPELLDALFNLVNAASGDTIENLKIALADAKGVIRKATE